MTMCKFCSKESKDDRCNKLHERFCGCNPSKVVHPTKGRPSWRKGLTKKDSRIAKELEKRMQTFNTIGYKGFGSVKYNGTDRHKQSSAKGGGYRENAGRSKKYKVLDSYGKATTLQSSFELRCSVLLNELNILWVRPKALKYDNRNYFADFYLPYYNVWLDPKNDYKAKQDEEKIRKVIEQNNIRLYVLLEEHLTVEYLKQLLGNSEAE